MRHVLLQLPPQWDRMKTHLFKDTLGKKVTLKYLTQIIVMKIRSHEGNPQLGFLACGPSPTGIFGD